MCQYKHRDALNTFCPYTGLGFSAREKFAREKSAREKFAREKLQRRLSPTKCTLQGL